MSKSKIPPSPAEAGKPVKNKKKKSGLLGRIIRRFFLVLFTIVILAVGALCLVLNLIFNGPSPAARDVLTMSLIEASATKWVPSLFIGEEAVAQIRTSVDVEMTSQQSDPSLVVVQKDSAVVTDTDEWADYPDGIRIETVVGDTYNAYVMIIRNPEQVYMATSSKDFSSSTLGKRINQAIEDEGVIAAINAGAFVDDGTTNSYVGSKPLGLVMSGGECLWTSGKQPGLEGFAGFNSDNVLVVSGTNLTKAQAEELDIRDGCCFGPALIINGEQNASAYNDNSGYNPRTAIGQRADGAVLFVCIDGRQPGSMGGTYADLINIMVEYEAVNACNMDGGSSTVMMYRDTYGRYGEAGQVQMINTYSLLQSEPRRMPTFWMVRPAE